MNLRGVWSEYRETGDGAIRERIIMDCMPLVKYVVGRVASAAPPHCDREELIQSGVFGLIDAIDRYDPAQEVKFETYAILRIRGAVIDEMRARDWVPRSKRKMAREVEALSCELESRDGTVPTVGDLARMMGVSREEMGEILQQVSFISFVSLEEWRRARNAEGDERDLHAADVLRDMRVGEPSARIELEEKVRALGRAISELPEQERIIVTLHYYEGMRLKDIGEIYGVSESRISQVHSRALVLLRIRMEQLLGA